MDLHPHDRGTARAPTSGAILWNGNLYCPGHTQGALRPRAARAAGPAEAEVGGPRRADGRTRALQARAHQRPRRRGLSAGSPVPSGDRQGPLPATRSLDGARPLPSRGRHRCPNTLPRAARRRRSPSRPRSTPKTAQTSRLPLHGAPAPFLSPGASAAERSYATVKDPATIDVARGWCRVMGLAAHQPACSPAPSWCATSPSPCVRRAIEQNAERRSTIGTAPAHAGVERTVPQRSGRRPLPTLDALSRRRLQRNALALARSHPTSVAAAARVTPGRPSRCRRRFTALWLDDDGQM